MASITSDKGQAPSCTWQWIGNFLFEVGGDNAPTNLPQMEHKSEQLVRHMHRLDARRIHVAGLQSRFVIASAS